LDGSAKPLISMKDPHYHPSDHFDQSQSHTFCALIHQSIGGSREIDPKRTSECMNAAAAKDYRAAASKVVHPNKIESL
jgi:hypothetical protein